jgi:nitroimidazol reductase NimA-like FMN-containing flavoprotein (pyridoxamine 5'-phosphate oxidase superfamily)
MIGQAECIELSEEECLALLQQERLGRLGFIRKGRPMMLPVNYVCDGEVIVFRSSPGGKQGSVPLRSVAFEIDGVDEDAGTGWSVVVQGHAFEITRAADGRSTQRKALPVAPMAPGDRDHWIEIVPDTITGRRILHTSDAMWDAVRAGASPWWG